MRRSLLVLGVLFVALCVFGGTAPLQAQRRRDTVTVLLGQEPSELFAGFVSNLLVESDVWAQ